MDGLWRVVGNTGGVLHKWREPSHHNPALWVDWSEVKWRWRELCYFTLSRASSGQHWFLLHNEVRLQNCVLRFYFFLRVALPNCQVVWVAVLKCCAQFCKKKICVNSHQRERIENHLHLIPDFQQRCVFLSMAQNLHIPTPFQPLLSWYATEDIDIFLTTVFFFRRKKISSVVVTSSAGVKKKTWTAKRAELSHDVVCKSHSPRPKPHLRFLVSLCLVVSCKGKCVIRRALFAFSASEKLPI